MVRKCRKAQNNPAKDRSHGIGVSSTYMQLRSRRIDYVRSEKNSISSSSSVDENRVSSCCASNDYRNVVVVVDGFIDLEEDREEGDTETSTYRRNTKRKLFENLRDNSKSMENSSQIAVKESSDCCFSGRRSSSMTEEEEEDEEEKVKSTTEERLTELEIEEFFVGAEKKLQENFRKKYNFDFEKEKPLEGRYEWIKLSE